MSAAITAAQPVRMFRVEGAVERDDAKPELALSAGQYIRLTGNNCWRAVLCHEGVIWITQNRDLADYVIGAGEMFLVSQRGTLIVQALTDARLEVTPCLVSTPFCGRFEDAIFQ